MEPRTIPLDRPTVVFGDRIDTIPPDAWGQEDEWIATVSSLSGVLGFILPLELWLSGKHRQGLHGIRLLYWLRWSREEQTRFVPALTLSWMHQGQILSASRQLLLVSPGTRFARLPDVDPAVVNFVEAVRTGTAEPATLASIRRCAGTSSFARSITYHALANDSYAAYRLWRGYRYAVEVAASKQPRDRVLSAERKRIEGSHLECVTASESKLKQPWIREFQACTEHIGVPAYPQVEFPESLLCKHVAHGLPEHIRVLFVDDQFDTGLAEALVHILFRKSQFTIRRGDEWVYAEQTRKSGSSIKARLVCVRSAALAQFWLSRWGILDYGDTPEFREWLRQWQLQLLGATLDPQSSDVMNRTFAGRDATIIDNDSAQPLRMTTVVLLDLRLSPETAVGNYDVREFASVQLKNEIKSASSDTVVLMFTASRQASAFAEIMTDVTHADGWLIKEAPDMMADDENSQRAVEYLLAALHLYAGAKNWLRPEFGWSKQQITEYSELYDAASRQSSLDHIDHEATRLFRLVKEDELAAQVRSRNRGILSFVQETVPAKHFRLEQRLICRRVVVATLLWTAKIVGGGLAWQPGEFVYHVRGDDRRKAKTVYGSKGINFAEALWFCSSKPYVLRLLLSEERQWLSKEIRSWKGRAEVVRGATQLLG
jgi:hypothetical protein